MPGEKNGIFKIDFLELITNDILGAAKGREASDMVAAIHSVWMEIGRRLGKHMEQIRKEERDGKVLSRK